MKKLFLSLAFLFSISAFAQTETLFSGGHSVGGFGGPIFQFASFDGQFAYYSGGGGGAIIDGKFFVGGYGMSLNSDHVIDLPHNMLAVMVPHHVELGMGGLWLGYIHRPTKLVHLNFSLQAGGGGLAFDRVSDGEEYGFDDSFFALQPSLGAEINLFSWMKVNVNGGYQIITGLDNPYVSNQMSSTPFAQVGLKFGFFAE